MKIETYKSSIDSPKEDMTCVMTCRQQLHSLKYREIKYNNKIRCHDKIDIFVNKNLFHIEIDCVTSYID